MQSKGSKKIWSRFSKEFDQDFQREKGPFKNCCCIIALYQQTWKAVVNLETRILSWKHRHHLGFPGLESSLWPRKHRYLLRNDACTTGLSLTAIFERPKWVSKSKANVSNLCFQVNYYRIDCIKCSDFKTTFSWLESWNNSTTLWNFSKNWFQNFSKEHHMHWYQSKFKAQRILQRQKTR